jgi:hypothetical protein
MLVKMKKLLFISLLLVSCSQKKPVDKFVYEVSLNDNLFAVCTDMEVKECGLHLSKCDMFIVAAPPEKIGSDAEVFCAKNILKEKLKSSEN